MREINQTRSQLHHHNWIRCGCSASPGHPDSPHFSRPPPTSIACCLPASFLAPLTRGGHEASQPLELTPLTPPSDRPTPLSYNPYLLAAPHPPSLFTRDNQRLP
ncbi:uncharacterized protein LAJ45_09551 [Morchella importuna]|uniref:uncharacterized protein n=1 Tax=Morchella importuna TaxID=1174673 RepID=UPI001E8D3D1B|nr:uncharacterized protein LAJ45_09551 [Morchella importuna]KAH8146358.1 hypothetical protein LAJ45_09551 [Morchella importuna]